MSFFLPQLSELIKLVLAKLSFPSVHHLCWEYPGTLFLILSSPNDQDCPTKQSMKQFDFLIVQLNVRETTDVAFVQSLQCCVVNEAYSGPNQLFNQIPHSQFGLQQDPSQRWYSDGQNSHRSICSCSQWPMPILRVKGGCWLIDNANINMIPLFQTE